MYCGFLFKDAQQTFCVIHTGRPSCKFYPYRKVSLKPLRKEDDKQPQAGSILSIFVLAPVFGFRRGEWHVLNLQ